MKKRIIFLILLLVSLVCITGCKKENSNLINPKAAFTITCTSKKDKLDSMETQNKTIYNFNKEQYIMDYSIVTNQKFKDKKTYNEYKTAQNETVKSSNNNIKYTANANDRDLTIEFIMTITNIAPNNAANEEEKETIKAKSILKNNESVGNTCTIKGISRNKLK